MNECKDSWYVVTTLKNAVRYLLREKKDIIPTLNSQRKLFLIFNVNIFFIVKFYSHKEDLFYILPSDL